jgi:thioredoxin reductase
MRNKIQDLIIIGAGPIGLACGIEAQKRVWIV